MSSFDALIVGASFISSFSRAGLNLVDRYQLSSIGLCPIKTSYWNNLLPLLISAPCILLAYPFLDILQYMQSVHIFFLATLLQVISYGFAIVFKRYKLLEVALLTKVPDFLAPLLLCIFGFASGTLYFLCCTCLSLVFFCISAKKTATLSSLPSVLFLSISLLAQIIFSYLIFNDFFVGIYFKELLLISFALLIWRFIFSLTILLMHKYFYFDNHEQQKTSFKCTFVRCFLNLSTQFSFIYVMSSKSYIFVLPILNSTGLIGAALAHYLIGEQISSREYLSLLLLFLLTNISILYLLDVY